MLSRDDLHDYQVRAKDFILDKKRCFLMLSMGLGKTTTTLTAITDLKDSFSVHKVLIIAPLRVANSVWKQESLKWSHLKHLDFQICTGDQKKRLKALQMDADVYVINRENVPWLVEHYGKKWPFDMVVIDESSSFKNASSQRFKALRKTLPFIDYIVLLTGTPASNGIMDLWSQAYFIDYGESLGKTITGYKRRFFEADYMGYSFKPRSGSQEIVENLMRPYTLSMRMEDYLELPDRIDLIEYIDLDNKTFWAYKQFERHLFLEIGDQEIEAINAASLANKLLQWCSGSVYVDEHKNWVEIHTEKLDALQEIIEENEGENILVAYNYKSDLERLRKRFPTAVVLDQNPSTIVAWNNGEIKLLLAHPQSAGHGLNIQDGGALIVWFSLCWSLEYYQQFNARLYRQGQTKPVRIVHLVVRDCIDERVMTVLGEKDAVQSDLLKSLR